MRIQHPPGALSRRTVAKPSGFLLVAVLFVLLIAGLTLVSLTGRSLALVSEAAARIDRLQQRWAVKSAQRTLLPRAGEIFTAHDEVLAESGVARPWPSVIPVELILSGKPVRILLADEGARVNLNSVYADRPTKTKRLLRRIVGPQFEAAIRLRPLALSQPTAQEIDDGVIPRVFGSWSQVFNLAAIPGGSQVLPALSAKITCWGPGRLNVARADRETAIQFAAEFTSPTSARRILEAWWEDSRLSLPRLIESKGGLSSEDVSRLQQLLADRSSCYSVTIECQSHDSTMRHFVVSEIDDEGTPHTVEFQF